MGEADKVLAATCDPWGTLRKLAESGSAPQGEFIPIAQTEETPWQEPPQEKPDILAYFAIEIATMGIPDQRAALQRMMAYCQSELDAISEGEAAAAAVCYPGTWPPPDVADVGVRFK